MKLSWEKIYFKLAFDLASRSNCSRRKVGCVITNIENSHLLGLGYNGGEAGGLNECARPNESGNCGCLHAEDNALLKVGPLHEIPKIAYVTHMPCEYCAKRFVNKGGFKKIYYAQDYRLTTGIDLLKDRGIEVIKFNMTPQN